MIELSKERVSQILHEETFKTEELSTILRGIYNRYLRLYEEYFSDIHALNEEKIAKFKEYHAETEALIKYYYMDIPLDVCAGISEFENKFSEKLLGPGWHDYLFGCYEEFKKSQWYESKSEETFKAEFRKKIMAAFYDSMNYIFRVGFRTGSRTSEKLIEGITGLLFGKK